MKTLILFLFLISIDYTPSVYWEQLTGAQQTEVLQSNVLPTAVLSFYQGDMQLSNDAATKQLLDALIQPPADDGIKALYFSLFNRIILSINPALLDILPLYTMSMVLDEPKYVLNYFIKHRSVMQAYCVRLGNAFYSNDSVDDSDIYDFRQFQDHLTQEMQYYPQYETILSEFYYFIQKRLNELTAPHRQRSWQLFFRL